MRAAQQAAARDPRITLWAELAVLAHLTGWLMPMAGPAFAAGLAAMDARLRGLRALPRRRRGGRLPRSPAISATVSGLALAAHVTDAMRAALDEGQLGRATRDEPQWLAPAWQWAGCSTNSAPGTAITPARPASAHPGPGKPGMPGPSPAAPAPSRPPPCSDGTTRPNGTRKPCASSRSGSGRPAPWSRPSARASRTPTGTARLAAALADFPATDWVPAQLALPDTEAGP